MTTFGVRHRAGSHRPEPSAPATGPYKVIFKGPDAGGKFTLSAYHSDLSAITAQENTRFFAILPDGNFRELGIGNNYSTICSLQKYAGSAMFDRSSLQVYSMEKNDPNKPPQEVAIQQDQWGNAVGPTVTVNTGAITPPDAAYLSAGDYIKVGTAWNPWPAASAYYYLIVSYTNPSSTLMTNGDVLLDTCGLNNMGFDLDTYEAFNLDGNMTWQGPATLPTGNRFSFANLHGGEVRHVYVRMKRNPLLTGGSSAGFKANLVFSTDGGTTWTTIASACTALELSRAPHDPNSKWVNQDRCTYNGIGTLTYSITFQNNGDDVARDVKIVDQFSNPFLPLSLQTLQSSEPNKPVPNIASPYVDWVFSGINLPGSCQTDPRIYSYDETVGWIKFQVRAKCPAIGTPISNSASITFIDKDGKQLTPIQTTVATTDPDEVIRANWPRKIRPTRVDPSVPVQKRN